MPYLLSAEVNAEHGQALTCNNLGQPVWTLAGTWSTLRVSSAIIAAIDNFLSCTLVKLSIFENHKLKNLLVHPLASRTCKANT